MSRGRILAVFGNMVTVECSGPVVQNATARCEREGGAKLLAEVVRVRGRLADLQVFEETRGLRVGDPVVFDDSPLSVELGPGLLGQTFDGLQNPLFDVHAATGAFLAPGIYLPALDRARRHPFSPVVAPGDVVFAGDAVGTVPEGPFTHPIMVPFGLEGPLEVLEVADESEPTALDHVAKVKDRRGAEHPVSLLQRWPVKRPLGLGRRILPKAPLVTRVRIVDSLFPVLRGGTYCIPGPFGAGKTILQHITSRHAEVDVVVIAACGERAGEVVETIREFPKLEDPRTGRSLMERTILVCNTSAMPVAAREASVYTAATLGEYYRQMGMHVLLLADSTSRWAQAMRELSGRLEEIPGEEAFPAYLESRIAAFYERAGAIVLRDGRTASLTIGGTVSPAGGNFEEPVTQGTLKVVGAFHGLSRARSDARRYPAIDPLESFSRYPGILSPGLMREIRQLLARGDEVKRLIAVVGDEGVSLADHAALEKAELVDAVYLQQDAFDPVDGATSAERQLRAVDKLMDVVRLDLPVRDREALRAAMVRVKALFRDYNFAPMPSEAFDAAELAIDGFLAAGGAP